MHNLDQLELFDISIFGRQPIRPRRRRAFERMYFAIRPPEDIADEMYSFARSSSRRRLTPAYNMHISTNGIGDFDLIPDDILLRASAAGTLVHVPSFDVVFDRLQTFGQAQQRPIVLRCAEGAADIATLRQAIDAALEQQGFPTSRQPATPHLTLWYDETIVPEQVLARPFRWRVEDFFLVQSSDGQPHRLPGHWQLDG